MFVLVPPFYLDSLISLIVHQLFFAAMTQKKGGRGGGTKRVSVAASVGDLPHPSRCTQSSDARVILLATQSHKITTPSSSETVPYDASPREGAAASL